jgi:hypothetical protein
MSIHIELFLNTTSLRACFLGQVVVCVADEVDKHMVALFIRQLMYAVQRTEFHIAVPSSTLVYHHSFLIPWFFIVFDMRLIQCRSYWSHPLAERRSPFKGAPVQPRNLQRQSRNDKRDCFKVQRVMCLDIWVADGSLARKVSRGTLLPAQFRCMGRIDFSVMLSHLEVQLFALRFGRFCGLVLTGKL